MNVVGGFLHRSSLQVRERKISVSSPWLGRNSASQRKGDLKLAIDFIVEALTWIDCAWILQMSKMQFEETLATSWLSLVSELAGFPL